MVVTIYDPLPDPINLERVLSDGRFRQVWTSNECVVKELKPKTTKHIGSLSFYIPTSLYTRIAYGIRDFNEYERACYERISAGMPDDMRGSFSVIHEVRRIRNQSFSIGELVVDYNGHISKTLRQHGPVSDDYFWTRMSNIVEYMVRRGIPLLDIGAHNIMVKVFDDGHKIPVFIDYKKMGPQTYPAQFWLRFPGQIERRIRRRFEKLKGEFKER